MKYNYFKGFLAVVAMLTGLSGWAIGAEIITAEDITENIVTKEVLVKTADNVIVLVDTSGSMAPVSKNYRPKTKYQLEKEGLAAGISQLPDLGYNFGMYSFTPWEPIYPMQQFDVKKAASALDQLPANPSGRTPLMQGLKQLEGVLQGVSGKTVVYLFSDGGYDGKLAGMDPGDMTAAIAAKHDVCFMVIDHSQDPDSRKRVRDMGKANACSRVIPFDAYISNPFYALAPLYYAKSDTEVVTMTEKMVTGIEIDDILFDFDMSDLKMASRQELDAVGKFLKAHADASAYFIGYADGRGSEGYNLRLSRRRAEAAAAYVAENFGINSSRLATTWYGEANPVASNDTEEGQALNRRVEITVGGM